MLCYILHLKSNRKKEFERRWQDGYFAEPVPKVSNIGRQSGHIVFVCTEKNEISYVAKGQAITSAGSGLRRLSLHDIIPLTHSISLRDLAKKSPKQIQTRLKKRLNDGGLATQPQSQYLIDKLSGFPELEDFLTPYSNKIKNVVAGYPESTREILAGQQEAVASALSLAGFSRDEIPSWRPPKKNEDRANFLSGMGGVRLHEDQMIINDLSTIPGFQETSELVPHATAAKSFENEAGVRVDTILANKLPLEQVLGVDLIYYNEYYSSFIMVQYKVMEENSSGDDYYRPDVQLKEEIKRMEIMLNLLTSSSSSENGPKAFRFDTNPFFLKLCPRMTFCPDVKRPIKGMYLPLGYWKLLEADSSVVGPRGGISVTFNNADRYFSNTIFAEILEKSWVGTSPSQSNQLQPIIRDILKSGRAVLLAVKRDK
jgi:hypothetical protein